MTCKDICIRHEAVRPQVGYRYSNGQKRCRVCDLSMKWDGAKLLAEFDCVLKSALEPDAKAVDTRLPPGIIIAATPIANVAIMPIFRKYSYWYD